MVDSTTRTVTLLPNSVNVSYLIRAATGDNTETLPLKKNEALSCQNGDIISLLEGMYL
jgi:hypothetical protein